MEYAQEILARFAKIEGRRTPRLRYVRTVTCAYCQGLGVDPKSGLKSRCPICRATGQIKVTPPVITCRYCAGSGRAGGDLVCLACKGWGVVSVRPEAATCLRCQGTGTEGIFYCNLCKGQGIV
jgi:DnaJ-class molecular chaperone